MATTHFLVPSKEKNKLLASRAICYLCYSQWETRSVVSSQFQAEHERDHLPHLINKLLFILIITYIHGCASLLHIIQFNSACNRVADVICFCQKRCHLAPLLMTSRSYPGLQQDSFIYAAPSQGFNSDSDKHGGNDSDHQEQPNQEESTRGSEAGETNEGSRTEGKIEAALEEANMQDAHGQVYDRDYTD